MLKLLLYTRHMRMAKIQFQKLILINLWNSNSWLPTLSVPNNPIPWIILYRRQGVSAYKIFTPFTAKRWQRCRVQAKSSTTHTQRSTPNKMHYMSCFLDRYLKMHYSMVTTSLYFAASRNDIALHMMEIINWRYEGESTV